MITPRPTLLVLLAVAAAPTCAIRSFPSPRAQPRACGAFVRASSNATVLEACGEENAFVSRKLNDIYINGSCQTFVLHPTNNNGIHHNTSEARGENVASLLAQFPDIRIMEAIMWRDNWDTVEAIFKALQIPVCFDELGRCGRAQWGKGKYALWSSLILAYAYQIRFDIPCMMIIEDDIKVTHPLRFDAMRSQYVKNNKPWFHRCGKWGECYMTNPAGARSWFESVYTYGVTNHHDNHARMHVMTSADEHHFFYNKIVKTNEGDIANSPAVNVSSFNYTPSDVPQLDRLLRVFDASDAEDPVVNLPRLARKVEL